MKNGGTNVMPQPIPKPMVPQLPPLGSIFPPRQCRAQLQVASLLQCGFTISFLKLEDSHSINGPRLPQNSCASPHQSMQHGMKPLLIHMTETTPSSLITDPEFVLPHPKGRFPTNLSWRYPCSLTTLPLVPLSNYNLSTYPNSI
jgi:hypothetical protein